MAEPTRAQESIPSRLLLLFVALSCLLLLACTAPAPEKKPPFPDHEEIAAAIAGYADVIFNFDQVRAIVVATDDRIVFEQYYGADQDAPLGCVLHHQERDLDVGRHRPG